MLAANLLLTSSALSQYHSMMNAGVEIGREIQIIYGLWITLFGILSLISLFYLFKPPKPSREGGSFGLAFLSVPLYAYMAVITGVAFTFFMDYPMGQEFISDNWWSSPVSFKFGFIYLGRDAVKTDPDCRYVPEYFTSMELGSRNFDWLILLAAALPTAYTGASGILLLQPAQLYIKRFGFQVGADSSHWLQAPCLAHLV